MAQLFQKNSPIKGWSLFIGGLCMGVADLIPGISGGTLAFILGFYHPLIKSLNTLNKTAWRYLYQRKWKLLFQYIEWQFLLTLGGGVLCALTVFVHPFQMILKSAEIRPYLHATFMGFIFASFYFCFRLISQWNLKIYFAFFSGALVAFQLTHSLVNPLNTKGWKIDLNISYKEPLVNYDKNTHQLIGLSPKTLGVLLKQQVIQKNTAVYGSQGVKIGTAEELALYPHFLWLDLKMIACGVLAVCALLLPGISGSYLLNLLGVYPAVISSFADFVKQLSQLHFQTQSFMLLANLGLGMGLGALLFARSLNYMMKNYPDLTLSVLCGFMMGSIRSVWPFWTFVYRLEPLKISQGPQLNLIEPIFPLQDPVLLISVFSCVVLGFLGVKLMEKTACSFQKG